MGNKSKQWTQLCWTCRFACDRDECIWVRTLKRRYKGTKLDEDGYIISCPKYEHDEHCYSIKEICDKLGITRRRYNAIKSSIVSQGFNISVEDYFISKYGSQDGITQKENYRKQYDKQRYLIKKWLEAGKPMPLDEFILAFQKERQEKKERMERQKREREERRILRQERKKAEEEKTRLREEKREEEHRNKSKKSQENQKKYLREYYLKNKEKIDEYRRQYYAKKKAKGLHNIK